MSGLSMSVSANADEVFAKIDGFVSMVASKAIPRAINKLAAQAQTAGLRKVNDIYKIGPRAFEAYVQVRLAKDGGLSAEISVKGKGLPMALFQPKRIKGKGGGVSVLIKGRRFMIPHAFIAKMKSGKVGVFARGAYGGKGKITPSGESFGRFVFGRKRFSINELFTFSPPAAFKNPDVTDAMVARVEEQMGKVINQEIKFASR